MIRRVWAWLLREFGAAYDRVPDPGPLDLLERRPHVLPFLTPEDIERARMDKAAKLIVGTATEAHQEDLP